MKMFVLAGKREREGAECRILREGLGMCRNLSLLYSALKILQRVATDGREIYAALTERSDILHGYIVPEYEALHTQSKEYIIDDIIGLMRERGIEI